MATKPVTILPAAAAAAGCAATCESYATGTIPGANTEVWTNYQIVATAVNGWEVVAPVTVTTQERYQETTYPPQDDTYPAPPYPADGDRDFNNRKNPSEREITWSGGSQSYTILGVTVRFRRIPTNLLVNSFNRSTPVQLVYDDRPGGTGLLVADF